MNLIKLLFLFIPFCGISQISEEITFQSDGLDLSGTLTLPAGEAPFPLVILVHGSGANNRDQTLTLNDANSYCLYPELFGTTIENFKDIAIDFQGKGIATFRYDKRSFTHGAILDPVTISPLDFVEDIHNAIDEMKTRNDIDLENIFLAGHSQGSVLIPAVSKNRDDIAGLISLAGAVTPIDSLFPEQFRMLYTDCANDPISGDSVANQFYTHFESIRLGTFPLNETLLVNFPGNPTNPLSFGYPTFYKDWIDLGDSVIANYNEVAIPTLVIHGEEDLTVPVEDADKFEIGFDFEPSRVITFSGVNHYLTPINNPNVSTPILDTISNWIFDFVITNTQDNIDVESNWDITIYDKKIVVKGDVPKWDVQILIFDMLGRTVLSNRIDNNSTEIYLNELTDGFYVISIQDQEKIISKKVFLDF